MRNASLWTVTVPRALSLYANVVFLVLWVGFVTALVVNQDWLADVWDWAQALPPIPGIIVWVLLLPIMVGLWIWQSHWPDPARIVGLIALASWTLLAASSLFKAFRISTPARQDSD